MDVPHLVVRRVEAAGAHGTHRLEVAWRTFERACRCWDLTPSRMLEGGSEALVADVRMTSGQVAVLKVPLAIDASPEAELDVLRRGGYAEILRWTCEPEYAWLCERLGEPLAHAGLVPRAQLDALSEALLTCWFEPTAEDVARFEAGDSKALALRDYLLEHRAVFRAHASSHTFETACAYAVERARRHDLSRCVVAHGDPHAHNALRVPGSEPARYVFVDPDGIVIEREYDLGVTMREWDAAAFGGRPYEVARRWCDELAQRASADAEAIWQWTFVERATTGIALWSLGLEEEARALWQVLDAWDEPSRAQEGWL